MNLEARRLGRRVLQMCRKYRDDLTEELTRRQDIWGWL